MPANLSPEYKEAQASFRKAREPRERLDCLREMLRAIPKHKGTEHLQADIKTRIKELTEELAGPKKGGARGGPSLSVRPEGAAQVVLLGPPNSGKSSLHVALTSSHAVVGPYPFATKFPLPGMLPHEDVQFQLVDLPPISADYMESWMGSAFQQADAALIVMDLGEAECIDQLEAIRRRLDQKHVTLLESFTPEPPSEADPDDDDPFRVRVPAILLASKAELLAEPEDELAAFQELAGIDFPSLLTSTETGLGLDRIGARLFDLLQIVRVYTKVPGRPADKGQPYAVRRNQTIHDVALLVHRGMASELKFARLWGSGDFDGQQVSSDHTVCDGDMIELHW